MTDENMALTERLSKLSVREQNLLIAKKFGETLVAYTSDTLKASLEQASARGVVLDRDWLSGEFEALPDEGFLTAFEDLINRINAFINEASHD